MEKLLSVIIPIYNVEMYLDRCMESIVNQSYKNLEIIMVDDGSPDNCSSKCDEWAKKDRRIRVIHKSNGGLSDARNKGIEIAKGDYLAFVDSDDFIDNKMFSVLVEALERTKSQISTCGRYLYDNGKMNQAFVLPEEKVLSKKEALSELLSAGMINEASWDKIYCRDLFEGIEFPKGEINEDMPVMPYLIEKAERIVCTGLPLYYYCLNPNSITQSSKLYSEKQRIVIKHIEFVTTYISEKYPEMSASVAEFQGRYSQVFFIIFTQHPELIKEYKKDYQIYREYLIKNLFVLLKSKRRSFKENIELLLGLSGIYKPIWKIKHFFNRINSQIDSSL